MRCIIANITPNPIHHVLCGFHVVLLRHIGKIMRFLASEHRRSEGLLFPSQYLLWTIFGDPVFDGVGLVGFKSRANVFLLSLAIRSVFVFCWLQCFFFLSMGWYYGAEVFGLIGCLALSPNFAFTTFFNNNNNNPYASGTIFISYE